MMVFLVVVVAIGAITAAQTAFTRLSDRVKALEEKVEEIEDERLTAELDARHKKNSEEFERMWGEKL